MSNWGKEKRGKIRNREGISYREERKKKTVPSDKGKERKILVRREKMKDRKPD